MPSSQDVVKFMLPSSACTLFMAVKEVVRTMHNELYSTTFTKLWQKYARMVDSHIFNEVISCTFTKFHDSLYVYVCPTHFY